MDLSRRCLPVYHDFYYLFFLLQHFNNIVFLKTNMQKNYTTIRLLIIDDNRIARDAIKRMLKPQSNIQVVASSGTYKSAMLNLDKIKPDIILLDFGLRTQNSLSVIKMVRKDFPEIKVIVMAVVHIKNPLQYIKAGTSGFVLKNASPDGFLDTICAVARGEKVLPDYLKKSLFSQIIENSLKSGKPGLKHAELMTKREKEVFVLISNALTNKEIAGNLNISELTVKSHVHNILAKLELNSRLEIANLSFINHV